MRRAAGSVALGVSFLAAIATAGGVHNVPRSLNRMAQSCGLSRAAIVREMWPAILNRFRVTSSIAIMLWSPPT
jgi:ABC-type nitrate/sulfonate/bicarbonate transport system permease component